MYSLVPVILLLTSSHVDVTVSNLPESRETPIHQSYASIANTQGLEEEMTDSYQREAVSMRKSTCTCELQGVLRGDRRSKSTINSTHSKYIQTTETHMNTYTNR